LKKLRAHSLSVIDTVKIGKSPKVPRIEMAWDKLTPAGQTARVRATLEGERRWCGNTGETLTGAPVSMGRAELLCALLDKRTLGCHHITTEQRTEAMKIYEEEYVKFSMTAAKHLRDEVAVSRDGAEEGEVSEPGMGSASHGQLTSGQLFQGSKWSDDDSDDADQDEVSDEAQEAAALEEAKRVMKNWKKYTVNWLDLYPHLKTMHKDAETLDLTEDLMSLDMGMLYRQVASMDAGKGAFGWIPTMASSSVGQLGALSAESYCERILSCANNVLTKGNTLLSDAELEMVVVLRMNREFMQFMREHYAAQAKQIFGQTIVRDE
jgi:hypothetical protein